MAMTPGGARPPSPEPPPKPYPPPPPRKIRDSRTRPKMPFNAALLATVRWSALIGGLVIIVDLGTQAIQQRTAPGPDAIAELGSANFVANIVLFSILGAVVARQTGVWYLAALAGLLASVLDG